eukprot:Gb_25619 [translate_table: standard]
MVDWLRIGEKFEKFEISTVTFSESWDKGSAEKAAEERSSGGLNQSTQFFPGCHGKGDEQRMHGFNAGGAAWFSEAQETSILRLLLALFFEFSLQGLYLHRGHTKYQPDSVLERHIMHRDVGASLDVMASTAIS